MRTGLGRSGLLLLLVARAAWAEDTFEGKTVNAKYVKHLEDVVWPLTAACDRGDDNEQRQCRHVRDVRAAELIGATLLVDGDLDAWTAGIWNPQRKSVETTLTACIRCAGIEIDGKKWYVVGTGTQPRFEGGRLHPPTLYDSARAFSDEAAAKAWERTIHKVRVQFLFKIADKPKWQSQGREGISIDILGYRVIAPCDGQIVVAKPTSQAVDADPKACRDDDAPATPDYGGFPESAVQDAMRPVVDAAEACHERYGVAGTAVLAITAGADGIVIKFEQTGPFLDTPTGQCIDRAMRKVVFPKSNKARVTMRYPIVLQ
jgi:hypothetical protein